MVINAPAVFPLKVIDMTIFFTVNVFSVRMRIYSGAQDMYLRLKAELQRPTNRQKHSLSLFDFIIITDIMCY